MNISLLLSMAAEACPEQPAFTAGNNTISFGQLYQASLKAAELFNTQQLEHVALLDESSLATPIALFGAALAGIPYAPLNYRLTPEEIDRLLERLTPTYLISNTQALDAMAENPGVTSILARDFLHQVLDGDLVAPTEPPEDATDIAVQLFTSGTTGTPKAAILRHTNMTSYILGAVEFASGVGQTSLTSVPPYHIAGTSAMLSSVYGCKHTVLMPSFDPESWLHQCRDAGVTNAFVVPTMLARILDCLEGDSTWSELPSLRAIAFGGGKMPRAVIERALELLPNVDFTNAYGLTETSSTIALLGPKDHREAFTSSDETVRARLSSVGKPLPDVEIEIRDHQGEVLKPGKEGEVFVRGSQVSGEYREKSLVDSEGWFATRDLGRFDEAGYLYLLGRADDIIVRGGENISPGEIEEVLRSHSGVSDAAVYPFPSVEWGESIGAFIVASNDAAVDKEDLRKYVRQKLRSSRVPEAIDLVEQLPYNEMGKLQRKKLLAQKQAIDSAT